MGACCEQWSRYVCIMGARTWTRKEWTLPRSKYSHSTPSNFQNKISLDLLSLGTTYFKNIGVLKFPRGVILLFSLSLRILFLLWTLKKLKYQYLSCFLFPAPVKAEIQQQYICVSVPSYVACGTAQSFCWGLLNISCTSHSIVIILYGRQKYNDKW